MWDYGNLTATCLLPVRARAAVELTGDARRGFRRPVPCAECSGWGEVDVVWDGYERFGCNPCGCTGNDPAAPVDLEPDEVHRAALADRPSFLLAEQRAREVAESLVPWGVTPPERVVWRVSNVFAATVGSSFRALVPPEVAEPVKDFLRRMCVRELDVDDRRLGLGELGVHSPDGVGELRIRAADHARWEAVAAAGLRFPDDLPAGVAGRPVADVPNIFAPVLEVWRTGFGLEAVTSEAILLYAPKG